MAELLKQQRGYVKGRITYFANVLQTKTLTVYQVTAIQNHVPVLYSKFHDLQTKLEEIDKSEFNKNERETFDNVYCELNSLILSKLDKTDTKNKEPILPNNVKCRLPEIDMPKFDGRYSSWLSFKDEFLSLVHNNLAISDVDRFRYLLSAVKNGSAYSIIEHIQRTNVNYHVAWQRLIDNYDNEVLIQKMYMRDIYNISYVKENSISSLQLFIDTFLKHFNALKALGVNVTSWDLFLVHHLCQRLDYHTRKEVEKSSKVDRLMTIDEFIKILTERCRFMNAVSEVRPNPSSSKRPSRHDKDIKSLVTSSFKCPICSRTEHDIYKCKKFLQLTPEEKFVHVKEKKLCVNCLSANHIWQKCHSKFNCQQCGKRHHLLLHRIDKKSNADSISEPTPSCSDVNVNSKLKSVTETENSSQSDCLTIHYDSSSSTLASIHQPKQDSNIAFEKSPTTRKWKQIVIATAVVWVYDHSGSRFPCRVVLDSASHAHFITEHLCQKLKIKRKVSKTSFSGIGDTSAKSRQMVNLIIASRYNDFNTELKFMILPKITGELPIRTFEFDKSKLPAQFELADPYFYERNQIDMLIGTEIYHEIVTGDRVDLYPDFPPFQGTQFGYIIAGTVPDNLSNVETNCVLISTLDEINENIQKFWTIEAINSPSNMSIEEKECERHYSENVSRQANGRYTVALPVKSNLAELNNSKFQALQQFIRMERQFAKNEVLHQEYNKFMAEYINLQHMELDLADETVGQEYYLPHHFVCKSSSETTKFRVVFNGSYKSSGRLSLNDVLKVGPTIQEDLFSILTRFRKHQFAFTADITKMYRQVEVRETDQQLQKIWWRDNSSSTLQTYRLRTVTYGTSSAPFLAIRTLKQLSIDEEEQFPKASKVLSSDFYVDDVLTGANTIAEADASYNELCQLLRCGGFELSKFSSNYSDIASDRTSNIALPDLEVQENASSIANSSKLILGINWHTTLDIFSITFGKLPNQTKFTKRTILSEITQVFDPLGLCAPVMFTAKCFMQRVWANPQLSWDDALTPQLLQDWTLFRNELIKFNVITIPRCIIPMAEPIYHTLHGFGDASELGYGCCIYVSSYDANENCVSRLVCSKSRIAPLRKQTIPRLELCASVLLAQLMEKVNNSLNIEFKQLFFWTDSNVTLFRIKSHPARYAAFVANRVSQIQETSHPDNWLYIPTHLNPADIVSRGKKPSEIQSCKFWWNGPDFLNDKNIQWPVQPAKIQETENHEFRKTEVVLVQHGQNDPSFDSIFTKFSNYMKLLRVVALCFRFVHNCRLKKSSLTLVTCELQPLDIEKALLSLVKIVQHESFKGEIQMIKSNKTIPRSNKLLKLAPFLDEVDMLRVGGRIHHSLLTYDQKHQFLLPANHPFTLLYVNYEHQRNLHSGPQALLNIIRNRFWIINGRNICRKIVHSCVRCFRTRPIIFEQVMGQLPPERIQPSRPFQTVGVDFCGPFYISHKIRSKVHSKVYISIFVCFCTKACHMELVYDLTTNGFIAALRRFSGRRGTPSIIFSDNATNFVGAKSELQDLKRIFDQQLESTDLSKFCSAEGISWKTIPPRSPHFGGLWEAAVKSAKYHLRRVIATQTFTAEELLTIIIHVEANLNSRPITPLSTDPHDLNALTPAHFLIGDVLNTPPDPSLMDLNFDRLSRWQKMQCTTQRFWKKWNREYLNELQQRQKWHSPSKLEEGTMVLIKEDNIPPMKWLLGRIIKVYAGDDDVIRVVDIKTPTTELKRAVSRICVLPFEENTSQ